MADIHFVSSAALKVAECFDRIQVNIEYTNEDYQKEHKHIEEVFTPLVEKYKYGRAMRIGSNHGSLSDRIMSYYGDCPKVMDRFAFEFSRIIFYGNLKFSIILLLTRLQKIHIGQ